MYNTHHIDILHSALVCVCEGFLHPYAGFSCWGFARGLRVTVSWLHPVWMCAMCMCPVKLRPSNGYSVQVWGRDWHEWVALYRDVSCFMDWRTNAAQAQQCVVELGSQLCQQTIGEAWAGLIVWVLSHTGADSDLNADFLTTGFCPVGCFIFWKSSQREDLGRYDKDFFATLVKRFELAFYLFSLFRYSAALLLWLAGQLIGFFCAKYKLLCVKLPT